MYTRYCFTEGCIKRTDRFEIEDDAEVEKIRLAQRFYSGDISVSGDEILIKSGKIHRVTAGGYDVRITCNAPHVPLNFLHNFI